MGDAKEIILIEPVTDALRDRANFERLKQGAERIESRSGRKPKKVAPRLNLAHFETVKGLYPADITLAEMLKPPPPPKVKPVEKD